ncbi:adenylate/guanylate cyclase domain-containing protein [Schaalia sp. lx-260]|uniref:adenylate/guanylate cyclase domain-containing protein n=1 Tax=Schaalia sp. lx-260 TaxID=2899082 RepID=UPI001E56EEBB|nr:adenylate/guanylate cyclase domain-containing protein [Schaalia sp. lx-260]MCD4549754.1 adenylate/guanylate cyclase domain-containing protein [Schaalia sp. lx-260]
MSSFVAPAESAHATAVSAPVPMDTSASETLQTHMKSSYLHDVEVPENTHNKNCEQESLTSEISQWLRGGTPVYSAQDLASCTGSSIEAVCDYWAHMGFPVRDECAVAFTQRDLTVYALWADLLQSGAIDRSTSRSLLRANAHLADRLGLWQVEALVDDVVRRMSVNDTQAREVVLRTMQEKVAVFEKMFTHSWQRQLEALLTRTEKEISKRSGDDMRARFPLNRSLGFVDMVSYTSSSTILGGALVDLIGHFEDACRTAVTEAGGRVVKMIGDAVLYIADDLPTGLKVAMDLVERLSADDEILPVRASFVRGDVFSRSGDVFGPTVNLASRLVDIAPVGKILTDPTTAAAIAAGQGGDGYHLEEFPSAQLRGFGTIAPYVVSEHRTQ